MKFCTLFSTLAAAAPMLVSDYFTGYNNTYVWVSDRKSWTEAQSFCREYYTDLASVRNQTEYQQILSIVEGNAVWIGLYRNRLWSDQSNSTFTYWRTNVWYTPPEPDNGLNFGQQGNQHCTAVAHSGYWTDEDCLATFPFVCYSGPVVGLRVKVKDERNRSASQIEGWLVMQSHVSARADFRRIISVLFCVSLAVSPTFSHQYHFVNESKSWTEAQRYCRENYTDLATIDNMEEMNSLINTVNSSYSGLAWIGLYDDLDSWRWSLDDESFYKEGERDLKGWYSEPDYWNGLDMCVCLRPDGTWFDENCFSYNPFICYDDNNGTDNYIWINEYRTWSDAQRYCRELYTDLASVRNLTENQRILNITGGFCVWIGLYRTRLWSDQHSSTYENWRPYMPDSGQPDNGVNDYREYGNQHCTAVSFSDSGLWTDENCLATLPFVCYSKFCAGFLCVPHQYHFVTERKSWTEAQRYCRENYTDLATIDNMEEMNRVINVVNSSYSGLAWLGLYDDLDSWRWSLDDESFYKENVTTFRNWNIQKPVNSGGNSMCVLLSVSYATWSENMCSQWFPFICYDGRINASARFILVYQYMSWTEAQRYCRDHYTDLASVRNKTENQNLISVVNYYYDNVWIGLYRTRSWSDQSNSSFSYWKAGQPDNAGQSEYCTAVSFSASGQWSDENCGHTLPFLCYSAMPSHQYHFVTESKSWTEAQRYCRENYTDLATIDNMEEMNRLINTVNSSYSGLAWIGLYDDLDSWRWSLEDDSFYKEGERDFRGWHRQPDNYHGEELCVYMSSTGEWFDSSCTDRWRFVCYNSTNSTYVLVANEQTWTEAQSFCRQYYTDLASVRNQTELQQILSISQGSAVWIGLYRNRLWSDQSNSTFTYWIPADPRYALQEPDNGFHSSGQFRNQYCTAVDHSGYWTDEDCSATFPFICYSGPVMGLRVKVKDEKNRSASQIKELVLMQGRGRHAHLPLHVGGSAVEVVSSYRYLGVHLSNNLTWSNNTSSLVRKAHQRLYFLRRLRRAGLGSSVLTSFYRCVVESVLCSSINVWHGSCSAADRKALQRVVKAAQRAMFQLVLILGLCSLSTCLARQYHFVNESKTWAEAQRYCREHFVDLASIDNSEDTRAIKNIEGIKNSRSTWIGLYDDLNSWRWSLDDDNFYKGNKRNFRNWYIEKPQSWGGDSQCVYFSSYEASWWTASCSYTRPFICYDAVSPTFSHQYYFVNESKSWTEAQRYCRENYTDLASIDNMEDMNRLINTVNSSYSGLAWIGLYDDLDSWRWSLDDDSFQKENVTTFRNWYIQKPVNSGGNSMCVLFSEFYATWWETYCSYRYPFICYDGRANASSRYVLIHQYKTWTEAQSYCRQNYTDLASVRNETENQNLRLLGSRYGANSTYVLVSNWRSWAEAQSFCRQYYTDLSSVRTQTELQQILSVLNGYSVWIGLYRNRWWSDQSNSTFTYWRPEVQHTYQEPDNGVYTSDQYANQHCTAVDRFGYWTDEDCLATFPFVCYS
ncbi:hypothetical protein NFI96_024689, partial [Prochilodus magdalenae]